MIGSGRIALVWLRCAALAIFLLVLLAACDKKYSPKNADQAGSNLEHIASSLDRYAEEHDGTYPTNLQDLLDGEYMLRMPFNGYKQPMPWIGAPRMRQLKPGQPPTNGDFVYVPGASASKPGTCKDYKLYLYGDKRDVDLEQKIEAADGVKMDYVILLISGERAKNVPGKIF